MPRIAIVEDQKSNSDSMRDLLLSVYPDSKIDQFFDAGSAEQGLMTNQFDLVIVDIDLGGTPPDKYGGIGVLAKLSDKPIVTLVVSGTPETNLLDVVLKLRAYDFIGKPFSPARFLNTVSHALEWKPLSTVATNELVFSTLLPSGLEWDSDRPPAFKWRGKPVRLTTTELRLVICLVKTAGTVVLTKKLVDLLETGASNKAVAVHINGVREKFANVDPLFDQIENDPGKGYVWKTEG